MTTFNTGNPVPSGDGKDRFDNTQSLDELVNSDSYTTVSRTGKVLQTWQGIITLFNSIIASLGWESAHLTYVVGQPLVVSRPTQLVNYNGSVYAVKQPATFPVTLTGTWATDSPRLVDVGDASVRSDLANPSRGATMIAWLQSGTGAVSRLVSEKLKDTVALYDYAGSDDGATDNVAPLNNAKNYLGANKVLRWIRRGTGAVKFNSSFDLNNVIIHPDPGMTVMATQSLIDISATAPAKILGNRLDLYMADAKFKYQLYPEHNEDLAEKRIWLDQSAADLSYAEGLDLASLRHETLANFLSATSDTWVTASNYALGSNGADWPYVIWNAGTANSWYRSSTGVRVGDELEASFSTGGVFDRAVFVQHATGYIALSASGVAGALTYTQKVNGVAPVQNSVAVGDIFTNQPQYYGENSEWRIKILSRRQFVILLNGQQVAGVLSAPSDIMRAGFGWKPQGSVTAASISGFTRTRNGRLGGRSPVRATIYGDSTAADIHGAWSYAFRKALEGMGGTTVESITNLAVPGYTSAQTLARVQALGFNGNVAIFMVGTNDTQGLLDKQQYAANMRAMIQLALNAGQTVIVNKPLMWYTQAEVVAAGGAAGTGQASSNATAGADYRMVLERVCANMSVKLVDLTQVSGPINAQYLVPGPGIIADTAMRDNIHETAYLYKKVGIADAKAVFGAMGVQQRQPEVEPLPINFSAGWSAFPSAPEAPQMFRDGRVLTLLGKASGPTTGGTLTGAQVGQLREDLWLAVPYSSPISYSGGNCKVYVSLTGIITVDNYVAATGSFLDFSVLQRLILRN